MDDATRKPSMPFGAIALIVGFGAEALWLVLIGWWLGQIAWWFFHILF
jgi:hypothetical protein